MITYILIVVAILAIFQGNRKELAFKEVLTLSLVMGIALGGLISFIPHALIRIDSEKGFTQISETVYSNEIASIKDDEKFSGSFFLGCGSIGSTQYYTYFLKLDDGGLKRGKMQEWRVALYEKDETPRIEWTMETRRVPWIVRFGFDKMDVRTRRKGDYRIIVPKGTVTVIDKFVIK